MGAETELTIVYRGEDESLGKTTREAEGAVGRISSAAKGAGLAIAAGLAVGTAAIVGAGVKMIGLASDAAEMQGKFDVVFANVGGAVSRELDDFAAGVGRSKFELRGMASDLGDILKPLGFTEEAAGDASVEMVKLATDLGSFNNMPMDEALARLRGTLVGSHENALAFGVVINENVLAAEMAEQGWDDLSGAALEQAKVQARMNLLMAGTTDAQGDAAKTSTGFKNSLLKAKAVITDTGTQLGLILLPALEGLFERYIAPNLEKLREFTSILGQAEISEALTGFVTKLLEGDFSGAIEDLRVGVLEIGKAFGADPEQLQAINDAMFDFRDAASVFGFAIDKGKTGDWAGFFSELARGFDFLSQALGEEDGDGLMSDLSNLSQWFAEHIDSFILWGDRIATFLNIISGSESDNSGIIFLKDVWTDMIDLFTGEEGAGLDWWNALQGKIDIFLNSITNAIAAVLNLRGELVNLFEALTNLTLPDWLMPGSPTPLEIGLRGITSAMDDLNRRALPAFAGGLGGGGGGSTYNNSRTSAPTFNIYTQSYDANVDLRREAAFTGGV